MCVNDSAFSDKSQTDDNPASVLKSIRVSNLNRLIIGQLNINSLRYKFLDLKLILAESIDILILNETKLDQSFPIGEFYIKGFSTYRLDRDCNGGGVLVYVREDIPCRKLKYNLTTCNNFEGIFLEINLRRSKWLLFAGYNPHKNNIDNFLSNIISTMDIYLSHYDNFLLIGDFNSEMSEPSMKEFCEIYNLKNLIRQPTCFKNPLNPSTIDLMLTNAVNRFHGSHVFETGLSDHHKMTITILKQFFHKQEPRTIKYRVYRKFDQTLFQTELLLNLKKVDNNEPSYDVFQNIFMDLLNKHAPIKEKHVRANNAPFMNRALSKAIMTRSRLRNRYLKMPNDINKMNYKRYRNFCVRLFKKEKKNSTIILIQN